MFFQKFKLEKNWNVEKERKLISSREVKFTHEIMKPRISDILVTEFHYQVWRWSHGHMREDGNKLFQRKKKYKDKFKYSINNLKFYLPLDLWWDHVDKYVKKELSLWTQFPSSPSSQPKRIICHACSTCKQQFQLLRLSTSVNFMTNIN